MSNSETTTTQPTQPEEPKQPVLDGQAVTQQELQQKMNEGQETAQFRIREKAPGEFVTKKRMHG